MPVREIHLLEHASRPPASHPVALRPAGKLVRSPRPRPFRRWTAELLRARSDVLHPAFYVVLGFTSAAVLAGLGLLLTVSPARPPLGVMTLGDVAVMIASHRHHSLPVPRPAAVAGGGSLRVGSAVRALHRGRIGPPRALGHLVGGAHTAGSRCGHEPWLWRHKTSPSS